MTGDAELPGFVAIDSKIGRIAFQTARPSGSGTGIYATVEVGESTIFFRHQQEAGDMIAACEKAIEAMDAVEAELASQADAKDGAQ